MICGWPNICLLSILLPLAVNSESYYSVNAPGVIKSNRKYSIVVALHEASSPCSIRVGIEGSGLKEFKDVNLQPFESQVIEFSPKKLPTGEIFLKTEGLSGLIFKNESILTSFLYNAPKIYIQTDKAVYKPQDTVRFRFVLLDEHTKPLNISDPIRVEILDANNNRVKHFKNISLTQGLYTGKFQLSKYPVLGPWQIKVTIESTYGYFEIKTVTIANYILPKFSVYLKVPLNFVLKNGILKVVICGKYTFEKYVEGNATIELWSGDSRTFYESKHVNIQNLGFVDFNLTAIKDIRKNYGAAIKAFLTEKATGITEMEEQYVNLRKGRYELIVLEDEIEFENNKPYSIKVYVKHWTGAPVLDYKTPVTMEHGENKYEAFLDVAGSATFEFDFEENADYKFQFKDSTKVFPIIYTNKNLKLNNREYYCRLRLMDEKLKLGKPILIEVSSIVNIPYLMYVVMGHASLIQHEYIKLMPKQKSYTINITPSIEMIPQSFIYVYYVHKGNLRYEEMILRFPYEFENQVSLSAPRQQNPGEEVTITLNAQPKSFVGILAVDLGVYLLDNTYDFDKNDILVGLSAENSYSVIGSAEYPGVISGLVTLTNAHYPFQFLPPAGGGGGGGFGGGGGGLLPTGYRFRQKFPETWVFDNYLINETQTKLTLQIPDSITTWRITAFSNNAVTGFGIVNKATKITTIRDFFISLNLPYSIKRGEILTVPVTIFNYSNQTLDAEIILYNNDKEFYFMESTRRDVEKSSNAEQQIKKIGIAVNKGKTVNFLIFPIKTGEITLKIAANSSLYSDAILQKLKVEPEGVSKQQNQASYLSIPAGEKISSTFSLSQPTESVPDSEYITFSVGGHYLVPTVENFEDLTQLPTGSGEQNIVNFAPSVLILQYLKVNGKILQEKTLVESLKSSIEVGYQQQLSFRHGNGGYSVFGIGTDEEPSTRLTAYVVRYFIKASEFIDIDAHIIESDLEYLASQQKSNGEFSLTGYLLNPNHNNENGLTAFILLAFLEDDQYAKKHLKIIENGVGYLNSILDQVHDTNTLSLMAAVIKRGRRHNADNLINQLKSNSKKKNGLTWWSGNNQNPANDIEITANAAVTLLDTPGDHTSILKWLIKQRNANGGFISCDDTVAGMEALVKFSEKYTNIKNINLKITYSAQDELGNEIARDDLFVDSNNVLNFQKQELPNNTRHVTFQMEGNGAALVQLNQQYNVINVHEFRHFHVEPKTIVNNADEYILNLCFTYLSNAHDLNDITNMVIVEVNLPSGFLFTEQNIVALENNALVLKLEMKNSNSVVVLYLNKLTGNMKYCLEIPIDRGNEVAAQQPAAIIMYDYYNISRSNTAFYSLLN